MNPAIPNVASLLREWIGLNPDSIGVTVLEAAVQTRMAARALD